jgi:TonB family protein
VGRLPPESERLISAIGIAAVSIALAVGLRAQTPDTWPPPGVARPGQEGVTTPALVSEIKPRYTPDAMRAGIQGAVFVECVVQIDGTVGQARVIRSLDKVNGLDDEALSAAKQWKFRPATKSGLAVPALIRIELTFSLGPVSPHWPAAFLSPDGLVGRAAADGWKEASLNASSLRITVSYPANWSPPSGMARLFRVMHPGSAGTQAFEIVPPAPTALLLNGGLSPATLYRVTEQLRPAVTAQGMAELRGSGQVRAGDRMWIWFDMLASSENAARALPPPFNVLAQNIDGARVFSFSTTEGGQLVQIVCGVMMHRGATDEEKSLEIQTAGATCAEMLKRLRIEPSAHQR